MARLNEDGALSLESFETLKRRYLRQNRELAKANSAQSIRVRALESEVAKLMSETITLKDVNHQLECELSRYHESYPAKVQGIHDNLEVKVAELSDLLRNLNGVYSRGGRQAPTPERVKSIRPQYNRPWRAPRSMDGNQDTFSDRLPALPEDREFSQVSIDLLQQPQVSELAAENSLSPDIGPPPTAHFDTADLEEFIDLPTVSNTRRRKRESVNQDDIKRILPILDRQLPEKGVEIKSSLPVISPRSKLKRKLDARDGSSSSKENIPGLVSRDRGASSSMKTQTMTNGKMEEPLKIAPERRKALAPRSANVDPLSPKKPKAKTLPVKRSSTGSSSESARPRTPSQTATALFSPPSIPQPPMDTPPPTSNPNDTHNPSRAGRRSRGTAVSYAEPNLRDKMRRPTKELVDAVTGEGRSRRLSSANTESDFKDSSIAKDQVRRATTDDILSPSIGREGERSDTMAVGSGKGKSDQGIETSLAMAMKSLEVGDDAEASRLDSRTRKDELAKRREGRRRASSAFAVGKGAVGPRAKETGLDGRTSRVSTDPGEGSGDKGTRRRSMAV